MTDAFLLWKPAHGELLEVYPIPGEFFSAWVHNPNGAATPGAVWTLWLY
jgi:hypothetical protein